MHTEMSEEYKDRELSIQESKMNESDEYRMNDNDKS